MWWFVGIPEPVIRKCMPILPFRAHLLMWLRSYQNSLEVISNRLSLLRTFGRLNGLNWPTNNCGLLVLI
jgi:hypothetical protein